MNSGLKKYKWNYQDRQQANFCRYFQEIRREEFPSFGIGQLLKRDSKPQLMWVALNAISKSTTDWKIEQSSQLQNWVVREILRKVQDNRLEGFLQKHGVHVYPMMFPNGVIMCTSCHLYTAELIYLGLVLSFRVEFGNVCTMISGLKLKRGILLFGSNVTGIVPVAIPSACNKHLGGGMIHIL